MKCPICKGPGIEMGSLGNHRWFRCRNCGMEFYGARKPKRDAAGVKIPNTGKTKGD